MAAKEYNVQVMDPSKASVWIYYDSEQCMVVAALLSVFLPDIGHHHAPFYVKQIFWVQWTKELSND